MANLFSQEAPIDATMEAKQATPDNNRPTFNGYPLQSITDKICMIEYRLRKSYTLWTPPAEDYLNAAYASILAGNTFTKADTFSLDEEIEKALKLYLVPVNAVNPKTRFTGDWLERFNTAEQTEWLIVAGGSFPVAVQLDWLMENRKVEEDPTADGSDVYGPTDFMDVHPLTYYGSSSPSDSEAESI